MSISYLYDGVPFLPSGLYAPGPGTPFAEAITPSPLLGTIVGLTPSFPMHSLLRYAPGPGLPRPGSILPAPLRDAKLIL